MIVIIVQTQTAGRDATLRADGRRLHKQQTRTRERERTEVGHVPVIGIAIIAGVLAHGRNHDAVGEGLGADGDRRE